ncbi:MAG: hypothetical protein BGO98_16905 [Myxococcales bacterium 68-20]|nr:hypothetical protein [Myxococcales bacterium]OJY24580.1 MAG: hypothetical protein BGO98_16905 [Myxococcales bacterium 68-20]
MKRGLGMLFTGGTLIAALVVALVGLGCTPEPDTAHEAVVKVKRRAASDFDRNEREIRTKSFDERTKIAEGCGQRATYIETCEACVTGFGDFKDIERCNCTWVMDTRTRGR